MTLRLFFIVLCSLFFVACSKNDNTQHKLILTGSSTIAPVISEIATRYENHQPNIRIDVQAGGSSRGVADLRKGLSDIGMISRKRDTQEQDLHVHTIAWDGVSIILHKDNITQQLSNQQIIDIYTGKITNWKSINGNDAAIVVINKSSGHSTLGLFLDYFSLKNSQINADIIIGDNQQGLKTVAGNPFAIAYVSIGAASFEASLGAKIRLLPINGVEATLENIKQQRFPLARPLNLITEKNDKASKKIINNFLSYVYSSDVDEVIKSYFFIPAIHNTFASKNAP